jgi:anti-sigma factor RsiW
MTEMNHDEASLLLPWLVNGTLSGSERTRVERHVRDCLVCRAELREQRALRTLVSQQPDVHVSAEQGFAALAGRLDCEAAPNRLRARFGLAGLRGAGRKLAAGLASGPGSPRLALAGFAAVAVAAAVALWVLASGPAEAPRYSTLTGVEDARPIDIDIVFASGTSDEDARAVLQGVGGTIVAGPSSVGRYTVRVAGVEGDADFDALIRKLRADPRVRFAARAYIAPEGP